MSEHDHGRPGQSGTVFDTARPEPARDHYTLAPLGWLAGCSDVGRRHETNQDALALAGRQDEQGPLAVLVVSDGVSTSLGSEQSAAIAADVTCSTMVAVLRQLGHTDAEQVGATMTDSFRAAHDAVLSSTGPGPVPGSCTLICAVVHAGMVTVGNVGDCRAYWVGDDGECLVLSTDDSVAQARIEMGMTREEAESGHQAHAITRWLGPESQDVDPRQVSLEVRRPGWLLVCSDGLWNYCSEAAAMGDLVRSTMAACDQQPDQGAAMLAAWANEQGGRDNITVALARLADPAPPVAADGFAALG